MMKMNDKNGSTINRTSGFSLPEVMISIVILSVLILSSLMTIRLVFSQLEAARADTAASQLLQSEMENLRLANWAYISELESGTFDLDPDLASSATTAFTGHRRVESIHTGLAEIVLEVEWTTSFGRTQSRRYVTNFSKDGLNDYYFRTF